MDLRHERNRASSLAVPLQDRALVQGSLRLWPVPGRSYWCAVEVLSTGSKIEFASGSETLIFSPAVRRPTGPVNHRHSSLCQSSL